VYFSGLLLTYAYRLKFCGLPAPGTTASALTNRPSVGSRYAARVEVVQPEARFLALSCELEIGGRRAALRTPL
jgi:hypothetical protein